MVRVARLFALLMLLAWPAASGAATAGAITLVYEIHVGGFAIGRARIQTSLSERNYRLDTDLETAGLIHFLTGFATTARSEGVLAPEGPRPQAMRVDSVWRGKPRWSEHRYGMGPVVGIVHPAIEDDEREPVPPGLTAGTVDPLSAGLAISRTAEAGRADPLTIPVFDGRRRYDLVVTPVEPEVINAPGFRGVARVIEVSMRRIAGFSRSRLFPPPSEDDKARIWFAPARPDVPGLGVPVRLMSDGPLGTVVANLVRVEAYPETAIRTPPGRRPGEGRHRVPRPASAPRRQEYRRGPWRRGGPLPKARARCRSRSN